MLIPALRSIPFILLLLSGCGSYGSSARRINETDSGAFLPVLRAYLRAPESVEKMGKRQNPRESRDADDREKEKPLDKDIEIALSAVNGSFTGAPGQQVDFRLRELSAGWRTTFRSKSGAYARSVYGAALHSSDVGEFGTRNDDLQWRVGPMLALELGVDFPGPISIYGRGSFAFLLLDSKRLQTELGLRADFGKGIGLLLGYREWDFNYEESGGGDSIDLNASGFLLGLEIKF